MARTSLFNGPNEDLMLHLRAEIPHGRRTFSASHMDGAVPLLL